jgi:precorrin-2 dehydrogenase/sirohydrochlorin ferrochelatase
MFLKLDGRNCLVVGGGLIGESKVNSLLVAGARISLVSPTLTPALVEHAEQGTIAWHPREFDLHDLDGVFVVIAATSDDAVNDLIFREADRRGILCNAVDQPPRCHFYFPAVVRRGALQIAISTAGLSPSLARRLRQELEAQFGPEYEQWLAWLGRVRAAVMSRGLSFEARKRLLDRLASRELFDRLQAQRAGKEPLQERIA